MQTIDIDAPIPIGISASHDAVMKWGSQFLKICSCQQCPAAAGSFYLGIPVIPRMQPRHGCLELTGTDRSWHGTVHNCMPDSCMQVYHGTCHILFSISPELVYMWVYTENEAL